MNPAEAAAATPHGKRDQSKLTKMNTKLAAAPRSKVAKS